MESDCDSNEVRQEENIHSYLSPSSQWSFTIIQHTVESRFFETANNSNQSSSQSPQPNNVILPQISPTSWLFKPILVFLGGSIPLTLILNLGRQTVVKNISEITRVERKASS